MATTVLASPARLCVVGQRVRFWDSPKTSTSSFTGTISQANPGSNFTIKRDDGVCGSGHQNGWFVHWLDTVREIEFLDHPTPAPSTSKVGEPPVASYFNIK